MHRIIFAIKRFFIFMSFVVTWPFVTAAGLWQDPQRGRALLLGLPGLVIGAICLSAVLAAKFGSTHGLVREYTEGVKKAEEDKDWSNAIAFLRKLTELQPRNNTVKLRLADALTRDQDVKTRGASLRLSESILRQLAPPDRAGDPQAHFTRAQIFLQQRPLNKAWLDAAERHLQFALEGDPDFINAKLELAKIHTLRQGQGYVEAEKIYRELFKEFPGYVFPLVELLRVQGKTEEAIPILQDAARQYQQLADDFPENYVYVRRLANCFGMLGTFEDGVNALKKGIERPDINRIDLANLNRDLSNLYLGWAQSIRPTDGVGPEVARDAWQAYYTQLVNSHEADKENPKLKTELTNLRVLNLPESELAVQLYDVLQDLDNAPDMALQRMGTYLIAPPSDAREPGNRELGIQVLQKGLERNPRNPFILNNLAFALMDSDVDRAFELANRAVEMDPNNAHYRDTRGNILMRLGKYDQATRDFEIAILDETMKDNPAVYVSLVACYRHQNMQNEAENYEAKLKALREKASSDGSDGTTDN